jgi:hypothetical protein
MERDDLVPDSRVRAEFGISQMTLWRWDRDPDLGFPPPAYIRRRKFRSRRALEAFKKRVQREGITKRKKAAA